jgi:hypothetical protein
MPGLALLAVAAIGLFALAQSSSKAQKKTDTTGGGKGGGTSAAPQLQLGSDTGQTWTPISPYAPPGADMALATVTLLSMKALNQADVLAGKVDFLASEVLVILQGSEKRADQIAQPLVAATGKVTGIKGSAGSVDMLTVAIDTVVNKNSDAVKLPPTALPNVGTIQLSALQIAAVVGA